MNWPLAFCIVGGIAALFGAIAITNVYQFSKEEAVAVACVQAGGEWKRPGAFADFSCIREVTP